MRIILIAIALIASSCGKLPELTYGQTEASAAQQGVITAKIRCMNIAILYSYAMTLDQPGGEASNPDVLQSFESMKSVYDPAAAPTFADWGCNFAGGYTQFEMDLATAYIESKLTPAVR